MIKERIEEEGEKKSERKKNITYDAIEWGLMGLALWQNFKDRRR